MWGISMLNTIIWGLITILGLSFGQLGFAKEMPNSTDNNVLISKRTQKNKNYGTFMKEKSIQSGKSEIMVDNPVKTITPVHKAVLDNGMTVLVRPMHNIPKVSIYLWYNVGSKDEQDKERGIAHLIEHMIFKGTDKLSESDINVITNMLSGSCNAFTSYDYTGYLFNMPTHHWKEILPIMSDCMLNCTFNDQMLNSEMKAVIQELKMYKDRPFESLAEVMMATIFADHPYHHPIIGYKQDLWGVSGDDLRAFYKKHYAPNNATLVIVGDVDAQEVFQEAKKHFEAIPADTSYKKDQHYFNQDIISKSVTLYRDIQQPMAAFSFVIPGSNQKKDHIVSLIECILGEGKSSRLYKKIVEDLKLATSLSVGIHDLFEYSLFFIVVEPKNIEDIDTISQVIEQELDAIVRHGITDKELSRAIKQIKMGIYCLLESPENQAYQIGKHFLATGDENYIFNYLNEPFEQLKHAAQELIASYLRPAIMHKGFVLPLPTKEKQEWLKLQALSDKEDERILSARERTLPVQPPSYASQIQLKESGVFNFPKAQSFTLPNGLKVLYSTNTLTPKINIILELKAKSYYDPDDKQGLYTFVSSMLAEGTKEHTAEQLADLIESRGMSLSVFPGGVAMSMLREDFEFGLEILQEILTQAVFPEDKIEKVRTQLLADLKNFWDDPRYFAGHLIRQELYKGHPYSKNSIGTKETLESFAKADLVDFYKKYVSPHGAKIAIVGDLGQYDLAKVLEKTLSNWQGPEVEDISFPKLVQPESKEVNYPINRDQVVLCLARLSIDRKHPDWDKLYLFDQIFGGGVLGAMSSRLFQLREQTGLFYTIHGSLISGSDLQPGMVLVKTIVSMDRVQEAEKAIKDTMYSTVDTITQQELHEAKNAIVNSLVDNFVSNSSMARAFLYLDKYDFPNDFFDRRAANLAKINIDKVKEAAKKVLKKDALLTLRVGRISQTNQADKKQQHEATT